MHGYEWLAGWLEGEGHFGVLKNRYVRIIATSTDKDTIELVHKLTGVGGVSKKQRDNPKWNDIWIWYVNDPEHVEYILLQIYPYMQSRRKQAIDSMLTAIEERKKERGGLPKGVRLNPNSKVKPYIANIEVNRSGVYLGSFATVGEAKEAYEIAREKRKQGLPVKEKG